MPGSNVRGNDRSIGESEYPSSYYEKEIEKKSWLDKTLSTDHMDEGINSADYKSKNSGGSQLG